MLKISEQIDGRWVDRDSLPVFRREHTNGGGERIRVAVPRHKTSLLLQLIEILQEPFQLLYVLHTPRGEGETGRYQSPELSRAQVRAFLTRFEHYLLGDARHDLWVRSVATGAVVVWDRHNDFYAYGDLDAVDARLRQLGFDEGPLPPDGPHAHHYRAEFDRDAAEVLVAFAWYRTPLRPDDEQFHPPPSS